jgi:hypothetical protein
MNSQIQINSKQIIIDTKFYAEISKHILRQTIGGSINIYIKLDDDSHQVMPLHKYIILLNNPEIYIPPKYTITHINNDKYDNRLENLMITRPNNISKDVKFLNNMWKVYISYKNTKYYINTYDTFEDAILNYEIHNYAINRTISENLDEYLIKVVNSNPEHYIPKDIRPNSNIPSFISMFM